MLTDSEKRTVRRLCLWPKLGTYFIVSIFAALATWFVLTIVDDVILESRGSFPLAANIFLVAVIGYLLLGTITSAWSLIVARRDSWRAIEREVRSLPTDTSIPSEIAAGTALAASGRILDTLGDEDADGISDALQIGGGVLAIVGFSRLMGQIHEGAERVARAAGIRTSPLAPYRTIILLAPVLAIALAFAPRLASSAQTKAAAVEASSSTVSAVRDAFLQGGCGYVSADDPRESYRSYGYSIVGYVPDIGEPDSSRLSVDTDQDGTVIEISFSTDIDITLTPEQNLERAEGDLARLYAMVEGIDVPTASPALLAWEPRLPGEFVSRFLSGTYYEDYHVFESTEDGLRLYANFDTDPEEEYDEYSTSSIYLNVEVEG